MISIQNSESRRISTLTVLAFAAGLAPWSVDILGPSLPALARDFGTSPQSIEITVYSFMVGFGIGPPLWGFLSDRLGRRPVMYTGMALYCLSSLACMFANDALTMSVLRLVQGVGASVGSTVARAVVRDIHGATGATRNMAVMVSIMAVFPIIAPLTGGLVADKYNWMACFAVMALVGVSCLALFHSLVPETLAKSAREKPLPFFRSAQMILQSPVFLQHALCNMFCVGGMILFSANCAFIAERDFQLDSREVGVLLAYFNGSIGLGTYLVWMIVPRLGLHRSVLTGAACSVLGWSVIAYLTSIGETRSEYLIALLGVSCLGYGLVISLCSGGAMTPFSQNAGGASSVFLLLQSVGGALIATCIAMTVPKQLPPLGLALAFCGFLAFLSKWYLGGHGDKTG